MVRRTRTRRTALARPRPQIPPAGQATTRRQQGGPHDSPLPARSLLVPERRDPCDGAGAAARLRADTRKADPASRRDAAGRTRGHAQRDGPPGAGQRRHRLHHTGGSGCRAAHGDDGPRARPADAADRRVFLQRLRPSAGERPGGGRCLSARPAAAPASRARWQACGGREAGAGKERGGAQGPLRGSGLERARRPTIQRRPEPRAAHSRWQAGGGEPARQLCRPPPLGHRGGDADHRLDPWHALRKLSADRAGAFPGGRPAARDAERPRRPDAHLRRGRHQQDHTASHRGGPLMGAKGLTIGVFDSGFGGLTVLRELLPLVAGSHCVYLGDTARLPYGSKSRETIVRYALSSARFLLQQGAELLVVACNTATALALEDLRSALTIPVVGVIQPGAEAAAVACKEQGTAGEVLVLATQATIESHAYARACAALGLKATEKACPLLVPLVEEGWIGEETPGEGGSANDAARTAVTAQVLRIYLGEALRDAPESRALLLGCTHYPLLRPAIERTLAEL